MKSILKIFCVLVCLVIAANNSIAQTKPYTPATGSAERKAIMDALRIPVEKELLQPVVFFAQTLLTDGLWVFLDGRPQKPDGSKIDYSKTVHAKSIEYDAFDDGIAAILKKESGGYRVVTYSIGHTDFVESGWPQEFGIPKALIPGSE